MKRQGLRLEDSQLEDAERLVKLTAIAAKAAAVTLQLVQARDGHSAEPASVAFAEEQIAALEALGPTLEGRTSLQKNPHPRRSLAWATWIIGRLGGWDGYPSSKPPGPITLRYGLEYFHAFAAGRQSSDLCMPYSSSGGRPQCASKNNRSDGQGVGRSGHALQGSVDAMHNT